MLLNMRKEAGFTMVEIMLTVVVLSLGAMLLAKGLSTGTTADIDTENRVIALNLVVEKLEELKYRASLDFNHSDLSPGTHTENQVALGFETNDERNWVREWMVGNYPGCSINELKDIRITISWTHKGETTRLDVEAETLIVNIAWAGT